MENKLLIGKKIKLVTFSEEFITEEYLSWLKDPVVNRYLVKPNQDITLDIAKEYCEKLINSENDLFFAIIALDANKHIGNLRLGPINKSSKLCQFSMMIGDISYHGKGIGSEAVQCASNYCFRELKMHKLYLDVVVENIPAIKVYEKNKFVREGLLKEHLYMNNKYHDLLIMGRLNPEE